jgi:hypothetical protein
VMLFVLCERFLTGLHGCQVLGFRVSGYRLIEKLGRLVVMGLRIYAANMVVTTLIYWRYSK